MNIRYLLPLLLCCAVLPARAASTVELAAEASRPAANDLVRAVVFSEASGASPAALARKVNGEIAVALGLAKARAGVTVKSGAQSTWPAYGREQRIEGWRMRSELIIESRDLASVSELLGQLQQMKLGVASVNQSPAPETRRQVEDETTRDALKAFQSRAEVVAGALGKRWQIKSLSVQQGGSAPMPVFRAQGMLAADAMAAPLEAGESQVLTTVSGQIELLD
ncbi:MAG: SIMPL domain-containing protein [Azonexaceae bacterium]|nr:SIMPL domain-containing protein [Azonexaceae bacterium]